MFLGFFQRRIRNTVRRRAWLGVRDLRKLRKALIHGGKNLRRNIFFRPLIAWFHRAGGGFFELLCGHGIHHVFRGHNRDRSRRAHLDAIPLRRYGEHDHYKQGDVQRGANRRFTQPVCLQGKKLQLLRHGSSLLSGPEAALCAALRFRACRVLFVSLHNGLHQFVTHNVPVRKMDDGNILYIAQYLYCLHQPTLFASG